MALITDQKTDSTRILGGPLGSTSAPLECHILIGESSPQAGGMCTHMTLLAEGLAKASQQVHVWSPAVTDLNCQSPAVQIHKTLGRLSIRDFRYTGRLMNRFQAPRRLLVYWVPHAYGYRAMNVPFCLWLLFRSLYRKDRVELMIQECFLPFKRGSWRQNAAALIQRLMTSIVLFAADHVWLALESYIRRLRPYALGRPVNFAWLPVPSNVSVVEDPARVTEIRKRLANQGYLIGHFGTFGQSITEILENIVPTVLRGVDATLVLIGSGGENFAKQLLERCPDLSGRINATGYMDDSALSCYLSACDVMIQPYPDGLTARRGSALAPLAHAVPVITNATEFTESLWKEADAVVFAPLDGNGFLEAFRKLQCDPGQGKQVGLAGRETYIRYFEPSHMIETIQGEQT